MKSEIQQKSNSLLTNAQLHSAMAAYVKAPKGVCPECQSDDLMRHMDGVGCDWSINFAVEHILQEELAPVDTEATFEDMIRSCYTEETTVGWMKFDTCDLMKSQDPISWRIARDEYIDELASDEQIITFDNSSSYYWKHDLETLLE